MKKKFNLGKIVFEHILGHAENATYRKALGYSLLIFGILMAQKIDLVSPTDILGPLAVEIHINHKLYEGYHFRDVPLRKNIGKMKEKVLDTLPESKPTISPKRQSFSTVLIK